MEESISNLSVVDFPDNFMDELLWEEEGLGFKERVACAMGHLQEVMGKTELLIQLWMPVVRGSTRMLTTEEQPYSLNPFSQSLAFYRDVSAAYSFAAEADQSEQLMGLPGRVFLRRMPEWTPDVRFFRSEEYPRIGYARKYHVRASLALPLFQGTSGNYCVAVMEMVATHQNLEYASHLHTICHALKAFDLRSSETSIVPASLKPQTDHLHTEVASILQGICSSHGLPLAITWGHQDSSLSVIVPSCYAADQDSRLFVAACSAHHLLAGEGIAGRAFATKKQCFARDVAIFSKWSYPLSHYARVFDLHAALAVPLLTRCNRTVHLVLELFFPRYCLDTHTQRLTLNSLTSQLNLRFHSSPHLMVDDQLAEEVADHSTGSPELLTTEKSLPWISPKADAKDHKAKQFSVSWEYQREGLKLGEGVGEPSFSSSSTSSVEKRKRKTKAEKDITLEILRQHFAGSLKDAAKNIGVCPTTLKRICRQHGISRWPSRKIKKVGHSLRKLQGVMDSVEGVQGSLHLASFYSSFPQLQSSSSSSSSFNFLNPAQTTHGPPKSPPSSSGSQSSSGSSTCCSSEEQQQQQQQQFAGFHKPALSHPQLLTLSSLQEEQRPVRVTSSLPPLPFATAPKKAKNGMKVKAMFGDSKMRMSLQPHWQLTDLRREIGKRFEMDDCLTSNFSLKYLDDDREWVLLTCDADLEECIQVYKSSLKETIRILVHHPLSSCL